MLKFLNKLAQILVVIAAVLVCTGAVGYLGWFHPWWLAIGTLTTLLGTSLFFLWKFIRIIWILENDLGQATQALEEVNESMQNIIEMKLYFDTPEVQGLVSHVMENVRMAQFSVNKMIGNFTDRSKQKFVMVIEEEPDEPLQPVSDPEQQQALYQEGVIASVESAATKFNQQHR